MALLTFTLPNGQPLVYTGQEMGFDHRFEFFEKDPVPAWEHNGFTDFYTALIRLRHENPALAAAWGVMPEQADEQHALEPVVSAEGLLPAAYYLVGN